MVQPKEALKYAEKLREWAEERKKICEQSTHCDECKLFKIQCWHIDNVGIDEIINTLTAIIRDLTPKTGGDDG